MWNLKNLFQEPRLAGLNMGSPEWFYAQKQVILSRDLIRHHYELWYSKLLADEMTVPPAMNGKILDIGSGGGFLKDLRPDVITSDVVPGVADMVLDARSLPFPDKSLRAIFMVNSFHHIPDVEQFLKEADRTLVSGGVISIIDPANTFFSRIFWTAFHPEPFLPHASEWSFSSNHHMTASNQALSWIVFKRDHNRFKELFPRLESECCDTLPWISYLFSGGVTRKNLIPQYAIPVLKFLDLLAAPLQPWGSLNWHIRIRKIG